MGELAAMIAPDDGPLGVNKSPIGSRRNDRQISLKFEDAARQKVTRPTIIGIQKCHERQSGQLAHATTSRSARRRVRLLDQPGLKTWLMSFNPTGNSLEGPIGRTIIDDDDASRQQGLP